MDGGGPPTDGRTKRYRTFMRQPEPRRDEPPRAVVLAAAAEEEEHVTGIRESDSQFNVVLRKGFVAKMSNEYNFVISVD